MFKKIRNSLVLAKVYLNRAIGYTAFINTASLIFLVLNGLQGYFDFSIKKFYIPIVIILFFITIVLGYLEIELGFLKVEQKKMHKESPYLVKIDEILERVKNLEGDKK